GGRSDAEITGGSAGHGGIPRQAVLLQIAGNVGDLRHLLEAGKQDRHPLLELLGVGVLQNEAILRGAHDSIDGEVLNGLHIELDAWKVGDLLLQVADDLTRAAAALIARTQADEESSLVQSGIAAVDADEGGERIHVRVFQDGFGQRLLPLRHALKGNALRRLGDALDQAGVLHRKEALWYNNVQHSGEHWGQDGDQQRQALVRKDPGESSPVGVHRRLKLAIAPAPHSPRRRLGGGTEKPRAEHGDEGERDDRRYDDGDG